MITNYTVTVKFGCTQSVGNYSNVRPEFEISLSGQGDDQEAYWCCARSFETVREQIHEIVDQELEIREEHLLYYDKETFSLVAPKDFHYLAIVSDLQPLPELWGECLSYRMRHKRLERLQWLIKEKYKEDTAYENIPIVDVQDLPKLEKFTTMEFTVNDIRYLMLLSGDRRYFKCGDSVVSCPPQEFYCLTHNNPMYIMDKGSFLRRMFADAEEYGLTIVDCLDGDFSHLPALPEPGPKPEQEQDDVPFDEDEDDEEYEEDGENEEDDDEPGF